MKKIKLFTFAVVASLASCSSDPVDPTPNFPADGVIRVTAGLDDPTVNPISRAGIDGNNITCYNLKIQTALDPTNEHSGYDPNYSYYAFMNKNAQNGFSSFVSGTSFLPADNTTPLTMLWKDPNAVIYITALGYMPKMGESDPAFINVPYLFFDNAIPAEVAQDQTDPKDFNSSDLVYMKKNKYTIANIDPVTKTLKLALSHRYSKIRIEMAFDDEFKEGAGIVPADVKDLKVGKTFYKGEFRPTTNELIPQSSDPEKKRPVTDFLADVTPNMFSFPKTEEIGKEHPAVYECILLPQALTIDTNPFKISFNIWNQPYSWSLEAANKLPMLEAGHMYKIALEVGKKVVTLKSITAEEWHEQTPTPVIVK